MSLYENPEQRVSSRHRLAEVVVVVDRQQVAVDVGVTDHHLHISDAVDMQNEFVELFELAGLDPVHGEPAKLGPILNREREREEDIKRPVSMTSKQEEETGM